MQESAVPVDFIQAGRPCMVCLYSAHFRQHDWLRPAHMPKVADRLGSQHVHRAAADVKLRAWVQIAMHLQESVAPCFPELSVLEI